jgi:predicted transcriptional regulator
MTKNKAEQKKSKAELSVYSSKTWTVFTNHAHVMILLSQDPNMVLREVALKIGITERAVQKIVADLQESGFIIKEKLGRSNHYKLIFDKPLRHPIEAHKKVKEVIQLINS